LLTEQTRGWEVRNITGVGRAGARGELHGALSALEMQHVAQGGCEHLASAFLLALLRFCLDVRPPAQVRKNMHAPCDVGGGY
jgi:hypothetical protein